MGSASSGPTGVCIRKTQYPPGCTTRTPSTRFRCMTTLIVGPRTHFLRILTFLRRSKRRTRHGLPAVGDELMEKDYAMNLPRMRLYEKLKKAREAIPKPIAPKQRDDVEDWVDPSPGLQRRTNPQSLAPCFGGRVQQRPGPASDH